MRGNQIRHAQTGLLMSIKVKPKAKVSASQPHSAQLVRAVAVLAMCPQFNSGNVDLKGDD